MFGERAHDQGLLGSVLDADPEAAVEEAPVGPCGLDAGGDEQRGAEGAYWEGDGGGGRVQLAGEEPGVGGSERDVWLGGGEGDGLAVNACDGEGGWCGYSLGLG